MKHKARYESARWPYSSDTPHRTSYCMNFQDLKVGVTSRNRTPPPKRATFCIDYYTTVTVAECFRILLFSSN